VDGLNKDEYLRVKVRRKFAWRDFKMKAARYTPNDWKCKLKVQFVGEPAVDEGGPRREFFGLIDRTVSYALLIGENGKKTCIHNVMALRDNEYFLYGQCIAMAVTQGSPGPQCFASSVANYILYGDLKRLNPTIEEIPDKEIRNKLQKLEAITDSAEFLDEASFNFSERFAAGYCKHIVHIIDKEELTKCVALHHTISMCQAELDQLRKGLELHGVLEVLKSHPIQSKSLL
jgi:hypothetical protein